MKWGPLLRLVVVVALLASAPYVGLDLKAALYGYLIGVVHEYFAARALQGRRDRSTMGP